MSDKKTVDFYHAFEEKYRGSRELIKKRLEVYLPFVEPLVNYHSPARVIDLGCGRGEWLELMLKLGFQVKGVDKDERMLAVCRELQLDVVNEDLIEFLKTIPGDSQSVVSGFHVAEHLQFDDLRQLVEESFRVLAPGGMLIIETPNPENISVGTANFYIDPTHTRPIPQQLLSFLPEYYGFKRTKVLLLQHSNELLEQKNPTLFDVINGVSPDYAVLAQKNGAPDIVEATTPPFASVYGATLYSLAQKFETRMAMFDNRAQQAELEAQQAHIKAQQAEYIAQQAETNAQESKVTLDKLRGTLLWRTALWLKRKITAIGEADNKKTHE